MAAQTTTYRMYPSVPVRVLSTERGQEVYLEGRMDVRCAPDVRLALHSVIASGSGDLYVHLGDVEIGDATGLGVLVECHRRAVRENRRLVVASITPRTERLLRASRLHRVLHVARPSRDVVAVTA